MSKVVMNLPIIVKEISEHEGGKIKRVRSATTGQVYIVPTADLFEEVPYYPIHYHETDYEDPYAVLETLLPTLEELADSARTALPLAEAEGSAKGVAYALKTIRDFQRAKAALEYRKRGQ